MRGDRVEIVIDAGDGTRAYDVVATRAGRRVEITQGRTVVEVTEVTRTGKPVRSARFMASRVLALVEHPAERAPRPAATESTATEPAATEPAEPQPGTRRKYADEW
jgi:Mg-chelatase subunit ChlI